MFRRFAFGACAGFSTRLNYGGAIQVMRGSWGMLSAITWSASLVLVNGLGWRPRAPRLGE